MSGFVGRARHGRGPRAAEAAARGLEHAVRSTPAKPEAYPGHPGRVPQPDAWARPASRPATNDPIHACYSRPLFSNSHEFLKTTQGFIGHFQSWKMVIFTQLQCPTVCEGFVRPRRLGDAKSLRSPEERIPATAIGRTPRPPMHRPSPTRFDPAPSAQPGLRQGAGADVRPCTQGSRFRTSHRAEAAPGRVRQPSRRRIALRSKTNIQGHGASGSGRARRSAAMLRPGNASAARQHLLGLVAYQSYCE